MDAGEHLDLDRLLAVAEGDAAAAQAARPHLAGCARCTAEVARLRSFIAAVGDELLAARPGCLSPDELATLPPGADTDHAHLRDCPLCYEEWQSLLDLEAHRAFGADAPPLARSLLFQQADRFAYAAAGDGLELLLAEGAEASGEVAGVKVTLRVADSELRVNVAAGASGPLRLLLTNDLFTKRQALAAGESRTPLASWKQAKVEAGAA